MCGEYGSMNAQGIYEFTSQPQYNYPYYGSQTETTEVTEEEYDGDGKLLSRKVTKTTKTVPSNSHWQYPIVSY